MTQRCVIYARVSTEHQQRDGSSLDTQAAACRAYAAANGYDVSAEFSDAYTGTQQHRPGLSALFAHLSAHQVDVVLVHSIDRMARDVLVRLLTEQRIEAAGTRVEYVLTQYDDTPAGTLQKHITSAFAEWENAQRVERTMRGKVNKAKRGLFVQGAAPYGYRIDADSLGGLAIVDRESLGVRDMFTLYVDGLTTRDLGREMLRRGYRPRRSKKWNYATIRKMLSAEVYAGTYHFGRTHIVNGVRVPAPRDQWVSFDVPPIISRELFDHVQRLIPYRHRHYRPHLRRKGWLLIGRVHCDMCGGLYYVDGRSYRHRGKRFDCRNHGVSRKKLEPTCWALVRDALLQPDTLRRGYRAQQDLEQGDALQAQLERVNAALATEAQRLQRLTDLYLDDVGMTTDDYRQRRERIAARQRQLQLDRQRVEVDHAALNSSDALAAFATFADRIRHKLNGNISDKTRRRVLDMMDCRFYVTADREIYARSVIIGTSEGDSISGCSGCPFWSRF